MNEEISDQQLLTWEECRENIIKLGRFESTPDGKVHSSYTGFMGIFNSKKCTLLKESVMHLTSSFPDDVLDKEKDKKHPEKSKRPIASGSLNSSIALFAGLILIILGLWISLQISLRFAVISVVYLMLNMIYTLWLEHVRYVCSLCAGLSYILRILAGGAVINLTLNIWYFAFAFIFGLIHSFYKNAFSDEGIKPRVISNGFKE